MKFGAIYKFICIDKSLKDEYIGSTKNLYNRICQHKCRCNNINSSKYNLKVYKFIRENGGWSNWEIVVIKKLPNTTKEARCYIEQFYKNLYKPTLNNYNAIGCDIERRKKHDNTKVKCDICDKELNKKNITIHIDTIHNKIKSNCPICDKIMRLDSIKRHIKRKH